MIDIKIQILKSVSFKKNNNDDSMIIYKIYLLYVLYII